MLGYLARDNQTRPVGIETVIVLFPALATRADDRSVRRPSVKPMQDVDERHALVRAQQAIDLGVRGCCDGSGGLSRPRATGMARRTVSGRARHASSA